MRSHHAFALLMLFISTSLTAGTTIQLDSDPGDYIGQGQSYTYSDETADIQYVRNYDNGITVTIRNLPDEPSLWWTLNLAAPQNAEIQPGLYENAERFPFQGFELPGLSFTGNGRGCTTLTGSFQVAQVSYGGSGNLTSLKANFEQNCEGLEPALRGTILYNTETPMGAETSGVDVSLVVCRNRTSGQRIVFETTLPAFDCNQQGLQVNPGDKIDMRIIGTAK